jgi:hypothetical protein
VSVAEGSDRRTGTLVGSLGSAWRGRVSPTGSITGPDGTEPLDWWVAAEDRWHDPRREASVRQTRVGGTPVVETRVRVPGGDVVQRVYAVADLGGMTVIDIENDSPASTAVVFSHGRLLTPRPPADVPIEGIDVPAGSVSFPVGHHSRLTVAISHRGEVASAKLNVPSTTSVVRGWTRHVEAASRLVLPDDGLVERLVHERCTLALDGWDEADLDDDLPGALLAWNELVRLGSDASVFIDPVAAGVERLAKSARTCGLEWDGSVALAAAADLLARAGETRAVGDVVALHRRLGGTGAPAPESIPDGVRAVAWIERLLARPDLDGRCALIAGGFPPAWLGANWEVHGLGAGPGSTVSYALRWHGERPALLWETSGAPVTLVAPGTAPDWSVSERSGEALWPAPSR